MYLSKAYNAPERIQTYVYVHTGALMYLKNKEMCPPWFLMSSQTLCLGLFQPTDTKNAPLTAHTCPAGRQKSNIYIIGYYIPSCQVL